MYALIVNPKAGFGRAKRVFKKIKKSPLYNKYDCQCFFTENTGHAETIAYRISKQTPSVKCIIVVGETVRFTRSLTG
ncbi:hypothetical protein JNUCC1_03147 [Lentibacillus sp. JNUCC-1]|nr:hypothetical protein [Lentibacillus sp. JNUCC-1]